MRNGGDVDESVLQVTEDKYFGIWLSNSQSSASHVLFYNCNNKKQKIKTSEPSPNHYVLTQTYST